MFGIFRLALACLVIVSHLVGAQYLAHLGFYAVRGFFVVSGFLMTAALNELYAFDAGRFWVNRILRLLPPYYLVCLLTLALIHIFPDQAGEYLRFWAPDARQDDVLMNLLVFPLQLGEPHFRLVPPYWSVAVEIEMYLLLWAVIARSGSLAALAVAAGLTFHFSYLLDGFNWSARYFSAPSAVLSFGIGAWLYFVKREGVLKVGPLGTAIAIGVWASNMLVAGLILPDSYTYSAGYYLNIAAVTVIVAGLADMAKPRLLAIDKVAGELAYPVFLSQWLGGFIAAVAFFPGTWRGWLLTIAATPVIIAISTGLMVFHRKFVEPLRYRIRPRERRVLPPSVAAETVGAAAQVPA